MLNYQLGDCLTVHKHGYVKLLEVMGSDETIVNSARISYDRRGQSEDRALIRYLLSHRHTSPFEMGVLRFEVKMPIFVARQWIRHRTASLNEMSARYTELPDEMFVPQEIALQSEDNKQGREYNLHDHQKILMLLIERTNTEAYEAYKILLKNNVARELARGVLPVNIYTKFIWKMDLHNLMHFLDLRLDPHAQQEIRDYAEVIEKFVVWHFPLCYEAFVDYVKESYTCSRMEVDLLRNLLTENLTQSAYATLNNRAQNLGISNREIATFKRTFFDG